MSIRKVVAGLLITAGIAIMAVPFFWCTTGERNTNQLINEFEQTLSLIHICNITRSEKNWKDVLKVAGQLYRYEFDNIVMVTCLLYTSRCV